MTHDQLNQIAQEICDREQITGFQAGYFKAGFVQGYCSATEYYEPKLSEIEEKLQYLINLQRKIIEARQLKESLINSALANIETKGGPY